MFCQRFLSGEHRHTYQCTRMSLSSKCGVCESEVVGVRCGSPQMRETTLHWEWMPFLPVVTQSPPLGVSPNSPDPWPLSAHSGGGSSSHSGGTTMYKGIFVPIMVYLLVGKLWQLPWCRDIQSQLDGAILHLLVIGQQLWTWPLNRNAKVSTASCSCVHY